MRPAPRGAVHALALVSVAALMWVDLGQHNDPATALLLGWTLVLVNFAIIAIPRRRRLLSMAPAETGQR